jgi:hypothetical protein
MEFTCWCRRQPNPKLGLTRKFQVVIPATQEITQRAEAVQWYRPIIYSGVEIGGIWVQSQPWRKSSLRSHLNQ